MAGLSITEAWNEAAAFVRREASLLLPIALLLIALPAVALQLVMPADTAAEPNLALFVPVLLVTAALGMIGNIAIAWLALHPGRTVGEALGRGARRFLPLLGASLLVGLALGLAVVPFAVLVGVAGGAAGAGEEPAALALVVLLIFSVLAILFAVRLMLINAVAAGEDAGPIAILRRSWNLTRGHFWKLLGFILLIVIVAIVLVLAVQGVFGTLVILLAGQPEPGGTAAFLILLLSALVQAVITLFFTTLVARIYAQLAGRSGPAEDVRAG